MTAPILRYFTGAHLSGALAAVSGMYEAFAEHIDETLPPGPETTTALRKLLESKDAAVRAALDLEDAQ